MAESFEITGGDQLQVLADELARVPVKARAQIATRMRAVGQVMETAVQRNARGIPVHGDTGTGLRQAIAQATTSRVKVTPATVTVIVEVDSTRMPQGQEKLPALMEGPGWTHQVFGNPKVTVFQPGHAYFRPAVIPLLPLMREAQANALNEATRTIRSEHV